MLAIITGSGFYDLSSLRNVDRQVVETPWGDAVVTSGDWLGETPVLFLPRHGTDHSVPPNAINYRANIWALNQAGATGIVATAVSGGIGEVCVPGAFVLIDDFIDYTEGRPRTFYAEAGKVVHVDVSQPYDPRLRALILDAAAAVGADVIDGGTYCATNGPRFESKAEIAMMRMVGGHLVGMTGCPEVVLARELDLAYASIGVISNWAAGLGDRDLSLPEIMAVLTAAKPTLEQILSATIERYTV